MTPTEQDKELREQIHKLFGDDQADDGGYHSCYDGKWIDMTNEVCAAADFIIADRKRVALGARIDELNNVRDMDLSLVSQHRVIDRIADLKAQQEDKDE